MKIAPRPRTDPAAPTTTHRSGPSAEALQANINNNVTALLVVGIGALAIVLVRRRHHLSQWRSAAGYVVAAGVWLALTVTFAVNQEFFAEYAHTPRRC